MVDFQAIKDSLPGEDQDIIDQVRGCSRSCITYPAWSMPWVTFI